MSYKIGDTVYYRHTDLVYRNLVKGTIVWLGEDSYSKLALIVTIYEGKTSHDKVDIQNISDDTGAREQWLKQNKVYEQEAVVKFERQKLEDMKRELNE